MIVYLHGFNSGPQSTKAQLVRRALEERGLGDRFVCPQLPDRPDAAIAVAERAIARAAPGAATFVGSSLGGFYATYLAEKLAARAVLINPAVKPQRDLESYLGIQRNLYSGDEYVLTREHIETWRRLDTPVVHPDRYLLLVETGDEVLDYREAVWKYAGCRQVVVEGGDHSLRSFAEHLPLVLEFAGIKPT
jgi:predicted esterase YcpF (UPF0227 family)